MHLTEEEFAALVAEALDSLPEDIARHLDNVDVVVQWWPRADQMARAHLPPGHLLLGLYEGVPLTRRGHGYGLVPPDKITLFQGPLEQISRSREELRRRVRHTLIHELAHHFGISDERLRELGVY
ncbi:MAG: metallopeptidase family protein [Chloroflexi bacterium]|nr:metallopeptidase family protein [Chloroflexota bacterium]